MGELKIDAKQLKKAVEEVNALEVEGINKIRTVGIKTAVMAMLFIDAVAAIGNIDETMLSDFVVDTYNDLPKKEELAAAGGAEAPKATKEKKVKEPKAPKAPKAPREPKEPKEAKAKSRYGHIQSAKSGRLDDLLFEGGTMGEIMTALDIDRTRFIGHSNHLKNDLGLTLIITPDPAKEKLNDHYKVKEAFIAGAEAPKKEEPVVEEQEETETEQ